MSMAAPPILCKHPMLETLEALAGNADALADLIQGIRNTGPSPEARLTRAEETGLYARYSDGQKPEARAKLLSAWGPADTLLKISDALGAALDLVRRTGHPLRCWWAAGATSKGIECMVTEGTTEGAKAIYFVLLTPPMGDDVAADKAFDALFRNSLQAQAAALKAWTDSFTPHS
jgi:hypothetical protein